MIGGHDCVYLPPDQIQETIDIKAVPNGRVGREIFFRKPKQAHRRIQPSPILRMGWTLMLLLQVNKPSRRLNQALKVICVV